MSEATKLILLSLFALAVYSPAHAADSEKALPLHGLQSDTAQAPAAVDPALGSAAPAPSTPVLRETIVKDSGTSSQENSVASFFQIDPDQRNNPKNLLMQPATVASAPKQSKRRSNGFYRCMWHILDNAGVPMFFGQDTAYVDPSISGTYVIPSPKLPREKGLEKQMESSLTVVGKPLPSTPASSASQDATQKIPQTELEGVPLPTPQ